MDSAPSTLPVPVAATTGRTTITRRAIAGVVTIGAAVLLGLASWFTPSAAGLGTHEQLNLPSCGWIALMDLPCPTCGMTTAFAHAADGNLLTSFLTQPLGFLVALGTAMALLLGSYVAFTGSNVGASLRRLWTTRTAWGLALVAGLAWGYKIMSYKGLL